MEERRTRVARERGAPRAGQADPRGPREAVERGGGYGRRGLDDPVASAAARLGLHHEAFIDACVESERYRDRRDVIEAALRLLEEREIHFGACITELGFGAERALAEELGLSSGTAPTGDLRTGLP